MKMENKLFDFGEALSFLKAGFQVTNSRGNVFSMEGNKVYCIPKCQYPKGKRVEVRIHWDSIIAEDWSLFEGVRTLFR